MFQIWQLCGTFVTSVIFDVVEFCVQASVVKVNY